MLPSGILGFAQDGHFLLLDAELKRHAEGAIRRMAQQENCTVHSVDPDAPYRSYDIWRFDAGRAPRLDVLLHRRAPYWAVSGPVFGGFQGLDDLSDEVLRGQEAMEQLGRQRVGTALHDQPLSPRVLHELSDFERREISKWKANSVGEVLFNGWD